MLHLLSKPLDSALEIVKKYPSKLIEVVDDGPHTITDVIVATLEDLKGTHGFEYAAHAPFTDVNLASPNVLTRRAVMKRLSASLGYADRLESKVWILHPGSKSPLDYFFPEESWKIGVQSIRELAKEAENRGITVALENQTDARYHHLTTVEDFKRFYEDIECEVKVTLDVGHAHLFRQVGKFLESLHDKIAHIHVSDNLGNRDEHLGIGSGTVDWTAFANKVKAMGFNGAVVVESVRDVAESLESVKELLIG